MLLPEQGTALIAIARKAILSQFSLLPLRPSGKTKSLFSTPLGCYVFLYSGGRLRGSAGVAETGIPLYQNIIDISRNAAFRNPNFPPLKKKELKDIIIEVNILSKPRRLDVRNPEEYFRKIRLGVDGILIKGIYTEAAILPQVAIQNRWNPRTLLGHACTQAQLPPDAWQDYDSCRVYAFETQIFSETAQGVVQLK